MSNARGTATRATYRFTLEAADPKLTRVQVQKLLNKATRDSATQMRRTKRGFSAKVELAGGLGGLGTWLVVLTLWQAAKIAGAAAMAGGGKALGEAFIKDYLLPRLRKVNLLPSKIEAVPTRLPDKEHKKRNAKPRK